MAAHRAIRDHLGHGWVTLNDTVQMIGGSMGQVASQASSATEIVSRLTSRQRTQIITVQPDTVTIEVSDYSGFDDFRPLLEAVVSGVEQVLRPDGVSRLGLRYINEITVPETVPDWSRWLNHSIVRQTLGDLAPSAWTGKVVYEVAPDQSLVLVYGTSDSPIVSPSGPLRRVSVPNGPVFLLDFDSFWQPPEIPEFESGTIIEAADRLHAPLRGLFDDLVRPDLVEHFRQGAQP